MRLFDAIRSKGVKVVESDGVVKPPAPTGPVYVPLIIPPGKTLTIYQIKGTI
ncbi:hypothetical protein ALP84_200055 [Pseudomonas cichorii]|uniref:Uncharacterized protein n=1 Tax=Pseudomonas cichorii TaxID=36746 RepID=A0A3M4VS92_PSECI|nr:hypothetical protein ALP84_200055 [Pseudomonas cichorii]